MKQRGQRSTKGLQGEAVVYSQVKFPDSPPPQNDSHNGQVAPQGEDVVYSQVKFNPTVSLSHDGQTGTQKTGPSFYPYRQISVGLGLLCFLLFIVVIFLSASLDRKNENWSVMENNLEQHKANYSILAEGKAQLQKNCRILAKEIEQLQENYSILTDSKDKLQDKYNILTISKEQLLKDYNILTKSKEQLLKEYNNVTESKNQLQIEYDILTKSMEDSNILAHKLNQLQVNYSALAVLKDRLQEDCTNLNNSYQQMLKKYVILIQKLPFINEYCKNTEERNCNPCPREWKNFNHKCYDYNILAKKSWKACQDHCATYGAGLVVIESEEEQKFITGSPERKDYWIGLTKDVHANMWLWVNGVQLGKSFWANGKPDGKPQNQKTGSRSGGCAFFRTSNGLWFDADCNNLLSCLCETKALELKSLDQKNHF